MATELPMSSKGLVNLKENDLLYTPTVWGVDNGNDLKVEFMIWRFSKYSVIQEGATPEDQSPPDDSNETLNPYYAKLQTIGSIECKDIHNPGLIDQMIRKAEDYEKEHPGATFKYRSLKYGYYKDPVLALKSFQEQIEKINNIMLETYKLLTEPEE